MFTLTTVEIDNFLSFDEATVPLNDQGLVCIEGQNLDASGMQSNGSGKSTVVEGVAWTLFGSLIRGRVSVDDVINRNRPDRGCKNTVRFKIDGEDYSVTRSRGFGDLGNSLLLQTPDETFDGRKKSVQERINRILPVDEDIFSATSYFGQGDLKRFSELTDSDRKQVFRDLLDLGRFEEYRTEARHRVSEYEEQIEEQEREIQTLDDRIDSLDQKIDQCDEKIEQERKRVEERRNELQGTIDQKKQSVDRLDEEIQQVTKEIEQKNDDLETIQDEIDSSRQTVRENEDQADEYRDEIDSLKNEIRDKQSEVDSLKNEVSTLQDSRSRLINEANELSDESEELMDQIENLDSSETCPTCGQDVESEDLKEHRNELKDQIEENKERAEEVIDEVEDIDSKIEQKQQNVEEIEQTVESLEGELQSVQEQSKDVREAYKQARGRVQDLQDDKSSLEGTLTSLKDRLSEVKQEKTKACEEIKSLQSELGNLGAELDPIREQKTELIEEKEERVEERKVLQDDLQRARKNREIYEFWEDGFGRDELQSLVLDGVTPFLNDRAQHYTEMIVDGEYQIEFATRVPYQSKEGYKDDFGVRISSDGSDPSDYDLFSGGEKQRVDICIMMALHDLAQSSSGRTLNTLFYDEFFSRVDGVGSERLGEMLLQQKSEKDSIFVITHNKELSNSGIWDQQWKVTKQNGMSTIDK